MDEFGLRLGRPILHTIVSAILIFWVVLVIGFIAALIMRVPTIENQVLQRQSALIGIQVAIGGLMIVALLAWLTGNEEIGLKIAIIAFLLSLVALQTLYFYLSQFSAITATLLQLAFLLILLAYRRWYFSDTS